MSEGKRGRKAIEYNLDNVKDQIRYVESNQPQTSRSALYAKVGELLGYSPSFVMNLINKHNIPLTTPMGKKGREKGSVVKSNTEPKVKDIDPVAVLSGQPKRRSYKQIIKRHCIRCAGGNPDKKLSAEVRTNIRSCHITDCDIHPVRPLRTAEEKTRRYSLAVVDGPPASVSMEVDETPSVLVPDTTVWDYQ